MAVSLLTVRVITAEHMPQLKCSTIWGVALQVSWRVGGLARGGQLS